MYVEDLPLLHIMSESTIAKLAKRKDWEESYAAAWSYLYFQTKNPPSDIEVKKLQPKMRKRKSNEL